MSTFDYFNKLTHPHEGEKCKAAVNLLRHASNLNNDENDQKKELNYILKRIIRALGSSEHKNKELNYCLLCTYLSTNSNIPINQILEIMDHELHPTKNITHGELGDIYFGRILTYGALIRAKVLEKSDMELKTKILTDLLHSSKQRRYLSNCAITFIIDYTLHISEDEFKNLIWPILKSEVLKPWSEQNLDSLHFLLFVRKQFQDVVAEEIKCHFSSKDIISKKNISEILRILIDIPRIACSNHPVYQIIAEKLVKKGIAAKLWAELDKKFQKPSKTTVHVATKLASYFCDLDINMIPEMLSQNYLQYIMKCCQLCKNSKKDETIILLRESLMKMINAVHESELDLTMITIKKLLLCPGDVMFEKKTGIKVFGTLYTKLTVDNVKELAKGCREIIENQSEKQVQNSKAIPWLNTERIYMSQNLTKLLGHPKMVAEHAWRLEQLTFLFKCGLCENEHVGSEIAVHIKDCFYRAIDHKLSNLDDLKSLLTNLITTINSNLFVEKAWQLRNPLEDKAIESWGKMLKLTKKIEKKSKNKSISNTFGTINIHMGLQLLTDAEMAIPSIDDLHSCFDKIILGAKKSDAEDEPEWVEVVVDLMISLLSRKSHLWRSVINAVFPHICPNVTAAAIHHILSVLDINDKQPLTLMKGSDDEEDSSDSEDESESENESGDESQQNGNANNRVNGMDVDEEKEDEVEDEEKEEDDEDEDDEDDEDMEEENDNQIMMNQLKMNLQ